MNDLYKYHLVLLRLAFVHSLPETFSSILLPLPNQEVNTELVAFNLLINAHQNGKCNERKTYSKNCQTCNLHGSVLILLMNIKNMLQYICP